MTPGDQAAKYARHGRGSGARHWLDRAERVPEAARLLLPARPGPRGVHRRHVRHALLGIARRQVGTGNFIVFKIGNPIMLSFDGFCSQPGRVTILRHRYQRRRP